MRMLVRVLALAVVLFGAVTFLKIGSPSAQAPPEPKNLKVLPKNMSRREVIDVMRSFSRGLGVRCTECHVSKVEGSWRVDRKATAEARTAIRKEREQRSVPVSEWWQQERRKVLKKEFSPLVAEMYADVVADPKWGKQFREFWGLAPSYSALPDKKAEKA